MKKYNNCSNITRNDNDCISAAEAAYKNALKEYDKSDIIRILSENDDEIKIIAIINLKSIDNKKEADLILSHLTGCDGRIREAVSFILDEFCPEKYYLNDKNAKEIIVNGILDINPNVARNVIGFIKKSEKLKKEIEDIIIEKTNNVLASLSEYIKEESPYMLNSAKNSKNHIKNKLTFNLYWLLETISVLNIKDCSKICGILTKTADFSNYTIREKTAKILSETENKPAELLRKLKNDENIYVKNQLLC